MSTHPRYISMFLETLGATADEVAARLRKEGVKGWRAHAHTCPVARLVKKKYRGVGEFNISQHSFACSGGGFPRGVPDGVSNFITKFDEGAYPDLEAGDEPS